MDAHGKPVKVELNFNSEGWGGSMKMRNSRRTIDAPRCELNQNSNPYGLRATRKPKSTPVPEKVLRFEERIFPES